MNEESLYSIAEIAVTLAGFTGLLGLFRSSDKSRKGELDRIFYIFVMCFTIMVSAFLPGLIDTFVPGSELVWSGPTVFMGTVAVVMSVRVIYLFQSGGIRLALPIPTYAMAVIMHVVGLLMWGGSLGLLPGPVEGYLLLGMLWFLIYSAYVFVTTLFWGTGPERDS